MQQPIPNTTNHTPTSDLDKSKEMQVTTLPKPEVNTEITIRRMIQQPTCTIKYPTQPIRVHIDGGGRIDH
jgi:hypothetical protein